jgi:L-lysine 6-transaminase
MAGRRVDKVADNVFQVSSRINSTWGGGLTDMVRSRRILEIIEADGLFDHSAKAGAFLLTELQGLADRHAAIVSNARGRGLMCAIDLPDGALRDDVLTRMREMQVLVLPCGERTVRFRPALNITTDELKVGVQALDNVLGRLAATSNA